MTELGDEKVRQSAHRFEVVPERCPVCDSPCFISSGAKHYACYHCFLSVEWDKCAAESRELQNRLGKYESPDLIMEADMQKAARKEAEARASQLTEALRRIEQLLCDVYMPHKALSVAREALGGAVKGEEK